MNTEKTVSFITLGCKVNQYDSDAMRTLFVDGGYSQVEDDKDADVYVINTCSVTSIGDRKSRQMVRRIRRQHPDAVIAVAVCYTCLVYPSDAADERPRVEFRAPCIITKR